MEGRHLAHVVRAGLERHPQQGNLPAGKPTESVLEFSGSPDAFGCCSRRSPRTASSGVEAGVGCELPQRLGVLREAAATPADPRRAGSARRDGGPARTGAPSTSPRRHRCSHRGWRSRSRSWIFVASSAFDCQLHHLRRPHIHHHHRRVDPRMETGDELGRRRVVDEPMTIRSGFMKSDTARGPPR